MVDDVIKLEKTTDTGKKFVLVEDLCSLKHFSQLHGLNPHTLQMWHNRRDRNGFPEPVYRFGNVMVFSYSELKTWWDAWTLTRPNR